MQLIYDILYLYIDMIRFIKGMGEDIYNMNTFMLRKNNNALKKSLTYIFAGIILV